MRVRLSSSLGADKALSLLICLTQFKVRVGVITDCPLDYLLFEIFFCPLDLRSVV